MAQTQWDHPVRRWRVGQHLDREELARRCTAAGRPIQDRYLEAIENGYRRPSYDLCMVLQRLSDNALDVHELRRFPLKGEKKQRRSKRSAA